MTTRRRISPTLALDAGHVICRGCEHPLTKAGQAWKPSAVLSTVALAEIPGAGSAMHAPVVLRRFACPRCGRLLDSEIALPDDPYLDDVVDPAEPVHGGI